MTKYLFLHYPKCSTCQKARQWLLDHHIDFEERHIVEKNPSYEELKHWHSLSGRPLKSFFNTSGLKYKELELSARLPSLSEEEQLRLLASDGMLVKRPLLVGGKTVLSGFKPDIWAGLEN